MDNGKKKREKKKNKITSNCDVVVVVVVANERSSEFRDLLSSPKGFRVELPRPRHNLN